MGNIRRNPDLNVSNARRAIMNVLTSKRDGKFISRGALKSAVQKNASADVSDDVLRQAVEQLANAGLVNKLSGGGVERPSKK